MKHAAYSKLIYAPAAAKLAEAYRLGLHRAQPQPLK
jgi:hypothetical protein